MCKEKAAARRLSKTTIALQPYIDVVDRGAARAGKKVAIVA